ncbi:MAG TPA: 50S ribosome-binding GTPase [Candidatus Olsenella pullistercoris]|uniref:Fe(2+) transporter FeoB n=1 Tax=Candidatus Olsenella pullistercoris TaxID=2838712 RepID=A0A9D2EZL0_9ACTN|nr:50S ribosome-binding GTPase [Candidatus Olsenella pullistercoris]
MAETVIGLAGNPNCGKTTLFNELTGSNGYVGNWPGVTVEKKQATWRANREVTFVDLPGIYSLSPYTPEEVVSRDYLVTERPDAVINLVDVTNLERNLYLTTQLLETGRPVVVGLNMCDLLKERGDVIDTAALSERLGVPVVEVSALRATNLDELVTKAVAAGQAGKAQAGARCFSPEVEEALGKISQIVSDSCDASLARWYSVKVFERDADAIKELSLSSAQLNQAEKVIKAVERSRDDDAESIITSDRYDWISGVMDACVRKAPKKLSLSEKIDRVVTNRVLGLPIFVAVMFAVYFVAVSTVGTWGTVWANDGVFGDGWLWNPSDQSAYETAVEEYDAGYYSDKIDGFIAAAEADGMSTDGVADAVVALAEDPSDADAQAVVSAFVAEATAADVVATDVPMHDGDGNFLDANEEVVTRIDAEGEPVLADGQELAVIDAVTVSDFEEAVAAQEGAPSLEDYGSFVPSVPSVIEGWLAAAGASEFVTALVLDGIVAGVGAVLGFIPQMLVLFVMLCFLEDCGYMSRVAFVMDRVFRRFGLSGKSFIPMLISSGCGVPGVMATKTIENEKDRRMTAMLTTMIPCGAKTPIIALVMGVLIGGSDAWWVAPMFYFLGLAAIIVSALMLKKTKMFAGEPAPFVMELPNYHFPTLKSWWLHVWERISAYLKKATTIIFAASVVVWFLLEFGFAGWEGGNGAFGFLSLMEGVPEYYTDYSLLAIVGNAVAWIFAPLGADTWQAAAASINALIAKENLVSTFGVIYGIGDATENSVTMWSGFAGMFTDASGILHVGAMCAFVAFNMLDAPCFAAIGTIRRQMDSPKWFWFAIGYQCVFAWVVGLIINQLWELFVLGNFGVWTVVAFVALAAMIFQIARPMPKQGDSEEKILSDLSESAA